MASAEEHPNDKREKRIALWPVRNREEGSSGPYLTGHLTLNGQKFYVTLWKRRRNTDRQPLLSGEITETIDDKLDTELNEQ